MRKIRSLIGLPVICDGRRIGRMLNADYSDDLKRLEGIWLDCGLRGTRYIPAEQLGTIGSVAILSDTRGRRRRMRVKQLMRRAVAIDGSRVGAVVGAAVDELSFYVRELEISQSIWDDFYSGRLFVTHYRVDEKSGDVLLLNTAEDMEREEEET